MADEAPPDSRIPFHSLIDELREFHTFCGSPSLDELRQVSRQLPRLYKGLRLEHEDYVLKPATVSAVLNYKRKGPPKRAWLVSFVLSCEWLAWSRKMVTTEWATGAKRTGPPDPAAVLEYWDKALIAAKTSTSPRTKPRVPARQAPGPDAQVVGDRGADDEPPASPTAEAGTGEPAQQPAEALQTSPPSEPAPAPELPPAPAPTAPSAVPDPQAPVRQPAALSTGQDSHRLPTVDELLARIQADWHRRQGLEPDPPGPPAAAQEPQDAASTPPRSPAQDPADPADQDGLSMSQARFLDDFGPLGLELYDKAEAGSADAAYRLGLLLSTNDRPSEGHHYLTKAFFASHTQAVLLLNTKPRHRRRGIILQTYQLGLAAYMAGDLNAAIQYCAGAARHHDTDAAYHLGMFLLERGHPDDAERAHRWIRRAAKHGHLLAMDELARQEALVDEGPIWMPPTSHNAITPAPVSSPPPGDTQPIDMERLIARSTQNSTTTGPRARRWRP